MATNIEIKARAKDPHRLKRAVEKLSDSPRKVIMQEDTFFQTTRGRMKLRRFSSTRGELIYYERRDSTGPKRSDYWISPTTDPDSLRDVLSLALGIRGVVRKKRELYFAGNTRIHLDEVEGLGSFLELEVVLVSGQSDSEGSAIAEQLVADLGLDPSDLIEMAYIDMLAEDAKL